jgi:UDP-N-acetylmuramate dehydrogenase
MEPQGVKARVMRNASMKRYTSMKVGGVVPYLFYPEDGAGVAGAAAWLRGRGISFRFLGNGTNVIVADRGMEVGVIRTTMMKHLRFRKTEAGALADAGAGLSMKALIRDCAARGLSGMEKLFGIPGTVGGAIRMNAGSFGVAVSDCVVSVTSVDEEGVLHERRKDEMSFAYRSSSVPDNECIVEATFMLRHEDPERIRADMDHVWHERLEKHPMERPSAGSVFRNRNGSPSWKYIDGAGLRGFRIGGACISDKHPNFIVNMGGASASDVRDLIETAKKAVREATGIILEEEVELWGFDDRT